MKILTGKVKSLHLSSGGHDSIYFSRHILFCSIELIIAVVIRYI